MTEQPWGQASSASLSRNVDIVAVDDEVLVAGDPDRIQSLLAEIAEFGGSFVDVAGVDRQRIAEALALATGGVGFASNALAASGRLVMLSKESAAYVRTAGKIPAGGNYFHGILTGAGGKFAHSLKWRPIAGASPAALLNVQIIAVQIALQAALSNIATAVKQVEGKVDTLLALAGADRAGDVLGHYAVLRHLADEIESHGTLPDADWDSVASLGPTLRVGVERLREHARRTLRRLEVDVAVGERAELLRSVVSDQQLGESLRLLVVAEESLYLWQTIRLSRIANSEPQNVEAALTSARLVLSENRSADEELLTVARAAISDYAQIRPLEFVRKFSAAKVKSHAEVLRSEIDAFANARSVQVDSWEREDDPTIGDAWGEIERRASGAASRALDAGANSIDRIGKRLQKVAETRTARSDDSPNEEEAQLE